MKYWIGVTLLALMVIAKGYGTMGEEESTQPEELGEEVQRPTDPDPTEIFQTSPVTFLQPKKTTQEPPVIIDKPKKTTQEPPVIVDKPKKTTQEPPVIVDKPKKTTQEPPVIIDKPKKTTQEPPVIVDKPKKTTQEPPVIVDKPKKTTQEPPVIVDKPKKTTAQKPPLGHPQNDQYHGHHHHSAHYINWDHDHDVDTEGHYDSGHGKPDCDSNENEDCPGNNMPEDTGCWTGWFDRDDPTHTGDYETIASLSREYPGEICKNPLWIEARTTAGESVEDSGNIISKYDPIAGFICINKEQDGCDCKDFKVRFMCPADFCTQKVCWTPWFDRDRPNGVGDFETFYYHRKENPGETCKIPLYIEVETTDTETPAISTGQSFLIFSPMKGFICRNRDQRGRRCFNYKVRYGCPCRCMVV